jgi:hypothetical protein
MAPKVHPALAAVRKSGANKVKVACSDIDGILRGKYLHKDKFEGATDNGFGFCDVVFGWDSGDVTYDNTQVTGWQHGFPDALAQLPGTAASTSSLANSSTPTAAPTRCAHARRSSACSSARKNSASRSWPAWSSSGSTFWRRRTAGLPSRAFRPNR